MLTSNGLSFASGVTKCRIRGLSIGPSGVGYSLRRDKVDCLDLRPAIASGADTERQGRRDACRGLVAHAPRLALARDEDEAGRPPGARPDPGKPRPAQPEERLGDARARI